MSDTPLPMVFATDDTSTFSSCAALMERTAVHPKMTERPLGWTKPTSRAARAPLLTAHVYEDGNQYTAICPVLAVASCGSSVRAAVQSLQEALEEYREFLEEKEGSLAPELMAQLRLLCQAALVVERRRPPA